MSKTALFEVHKELDAKLAPVNSWDLPLFYPGGSVAEHRHCHTGAIIFDGGHRKIWQFTGKISELDKSFALPLTETVPGSVHENLLLNHSGKIAAAYTICRMGENDLLAIAHPGCVVPFPGGNDLSNVLSSFTLNGKKAAEILREAASEIPAENCWQKLTFTDEGEDFRAITAHIPRFKEPGFEFIFNAEYAADIYDIFYRNMAVMPAGFHAYESLRIESCTPAWGSELTPERTPKECNFAGITGEAPQVKMISAVMPRHPAKAGDKICDDTGNEIGVVTGGAFCPSENRAKILGFISAAFEIHPGTKIMCGEISAEIE